MAQPVGTFKHSSCCRQSGFEDLSKGGGMLDFEGLRLAWGDGAVENHLVYCVWQMIEPLQQTIIRLHVLVAGKATATLPELRQSGLGSNAPKSVVCVKFCN